MTLRVTKPAFYRGDRTSVAIYRRDVELIEAATAVVKSANPDVSIAAPDVMSLLLSLGWSAMKTMCQQPEERT